jgi:hypothetical protein
MIQTKIEQITSVEFSDVPSNQLQLISFAMNTRCEVNSTPPGNVRCLLTGDSLGRLTEPQVQLLQKWGKTLRGHARAAATAAATMQIFVKTLTGKTLTIDVLQSDDIRML